ncbi:GNAT family N-acetyltransferase [Yunchengibacter salinarum]|uniref:GNAT family N-acetyltransferase n=1 Tax=Yunchengibacter salinarum TaxID=3133399 RepID=UPI0035B5C23B
MPEKSDLVMRRARDGDRDGLVALIGDCFSEYPGVVLDLPGIDRDLERFATTLSAAGGEGFVVEEDDRIVACVAYAPVDDRVFEVKRLYVAAPLRGSGLGITLLQLVESRARKRGAREMIAWSDSRFTRAHAFYQREGYQRCPDTRLLHDPSETEEWLFGRQLS